MAFWPGGAWVAVIALVCVWSVVGFGGNATADSAPAGLRVYWVDVEGGAATLIVSPRGESVLIDSGMPGGRDPGRIHRVATEIAGLERIDHYVNTHFHLDHFGGTAELSELMPIGHVHDKGVPDRSPDRNRNDTRFPLMIKPYREMKVDMRSVLKPGDEIRLRPGVGDDKTVRLRCLAADQRMVDPPEDAVANPLCDADVPEKPVDLSDNANSVVMLVSYGDFRLFIGGDLTWNVERALVCPINRVGEVDVYQVNHHGLDQSNHPLLVKSLKPTVAIMSNGTRKGCGAETFATLKGTPSIQSIFQIHRNLREDSENNTAEERIANLHAECEANPIELAVDRDARQYTVRIPATGHSERFTVVPGRQGQ